MGKLHRLAVILIVLVTLMSMTAPALAWENRHPTPKHSFRAHLSGSQEVPPHRTPATGSATFSLSPDGTKLYYVLRVEDIRNVTAAHIHLGRPGVNGPIVVFLYGPKLIPDRFSGTLATGTITAANLVGPLAHHRWRDLLREMENGNTYVNVHTQQFPDGEIRGQIHR